jgi:hypothetical protein
MQLLKAQRYSKTGLKNGGEGKERNRCCGNNDVRSFTFKSWDMFFKGIG